MINVFAVRSGVLRPLTGPADPAVLPADALWIDLLAPTPEEEDSVEQLLGIGMSRATPPWTLRTVRSH
jgi:Mg2+ and Co2+ transporter CorA